jgi:26S proteasome regulatory subunit N6
LIEQVATIENTVDLQVDLCKEWIEWTVETKRTFLRQRIEVKLASLYLQKRDFTSALTVITKLVTEVKRLDDKPLLVEIQLLESHAQHGIKALAKAKAALTAARTSANAIYCPPLLQAQIDIMSGTLHAEERDYKTAYSYFYEAFETYSSLDDPKAVVSLKYMLLCKIMTKSAEDVHSIISGKMALKYAGREVEAMKAVATAHQNRSLSSFEKAIQTYKDELSSDTIIQTHLQELYDTLLEQNLIRIIEPFSNVEIEHIANLIGLPRAAVEKKLSLMILDKKFNGILDQGAGCLIVFDDPVTDKTYPTALETISHMSHVVDSLYDKTVKLS